MDKQGAGTLTLGGALSYTGGTEIDAGTLVLAGSTSQSGRRGITDNAALVFGQAASSSFNGAISRHRQHHQSMARGTLTLAGPYDFTGAITVAAGTLVLTGDTTAAQRDHHRQRRLGLCPKR